MRVVQGTGDIKRVDFARRVRGFAGSIWGVSLLLALGWQLLMTVASVVAQSYLGEGSRTLLSHTSYWDGGWFLSILGGSYADPASPAPVFYPLFPLVVYAAQTLTFHMIDPLVLGLVINTASLWLALVALLKIADALALGKHRRWATALFLSAPTAMFMHMFYSEAIFCAVGFWAYLFALRRQWGVMALLLGLLTAARLPALLFVGLCGLEFMRAHRWRIRETINPNLLWFLLAPLGFVAYGLYLLAVRGDFLTMFHSYELTQDWTYHVLNPNFVHTILKQAYAVFLAVTGANHFFDSGVIISSILPLLGLAVLFAASLYALFVLRDKFIPLGIFGLAAIVLFTINNNTVSVHRYLLPCLTIYLVAAAALGRFAILRPVLYAVICLGVLIQAYLVCLFVSLRFAG